MDAIAILDVKGCERCTCFVSIARRWEVKRDRLAVLVGIDTLNRNVSE